jgi:hypothetical protein
MKSSDASRRAMLSAFAILPVLPILLPTSAMAQFPAPLTGPIPVTDSLPSWNDTAPKKAILDFVDRVTKQGSPSPAATRPSSATQAETVFR